jgi:hypothetical protein
MPKKLVIIIALAIFAASIAGCTSSPTTSNNTSATNNTHIAPLPAADKVLNFSETDTAYVPNTEGTKIIIADFSPYVNATNSSDRGYNVSLWATNMSIGQTVNFTIGLRNGSVINWSNVTVKSDPNFTTTPGSGGGGTLGPLRESSYAGTSPYYVKAVYSEANNPAANYTVVWRLDTI